jgi:ABC-type multidrug transport system fused ATPase/permease subunit
MILNKFLNLINKILLSIPKKILVQIIFLFIIILISSFIEIIGLGLIPIFVSILINPDYSLILKGTDLTNVFNLFFKDRNIFVLFPILIITIYIIKNLIFTFVIFSESKIIRNIKLFYINYLFKIYLNKPFEFFLNNNSSEILKNIFNETQTATSMITNILKFLREFLILISIVTLIFIYNPLITASSVIFLSLFFFIFYFLSKKKLLDLGTKRLNYLDKIYKNINILSGAIKDIKIYNKEKFFSNNFFQNTYSYENVIFKISILEKMPKVFFEVVTILLIFGIISIYFNLNGNVEDLLPIIALLSVSFIRLLPAFVSMSSALYFIRYVKISFDKITSQIISSKEKKYLKHSVYRNYYDLKDKMISANNLSFNFSNKPGEKSLKKINFNIKRGQMIGIIGKSGSGKSTIVNIILGLLKPTEGQLKIDDKNNLKNKNLISYVPQDIYLIDDTLRKNIAFGEEENFIDNKMIDEVIKLAELDNLVNKSKDGPNLLVGERGVRLSGGEKQRIGIARALYKKSDIIIFDEATSALDYFTESQILNSILKLKNKFTTLIVTHRLSTVQMCDNIFLIDQGELVDVGTLEYLSKKYPKILKNNYENKL